MPTRYLSEPAFPPYAHIPGRTPHPVSDPQGHSHASDSMAGRPDWQRYLFGIDLFNAGYYWEAHETWEPLWQAAKTTSADMVSPTVPDTWESMWWQASRHAVRVRFLKGLIRLAAAGVKVRTGQARGVLDHARAAGECFQAVAAALPERSRFLGLHLAELSGFAHLAETCSIETLDSTPLVRIVFSFRLEPRLEGSS